MNNDSLKFRVFKAIMASSLQAFRWLYQRSDYSCNYLPLDYV